MAVVFPVVDRRLHRTPFIDYQLRRIVGCGFGDPERLVAALWHLRRFVDLARALETLAREAAGRSAWLEAAGYQRGAEFFTPATSAERRVAYDRFLQLFDRAFERDGLTRVHVPFETGALPAYHVEARGGRAVNRTVLIHGGFDSLIEEFAGIWLFLANAGFDVIAFEGPGQGGARLVHGLTFDHAWERPVAAVLDHFGVERADLVGISMGGWWSLRAAALEARIERVVAWPPVYDWLAKLPRVAQRLVRWMVRFRGLMNVSIRIRMQLFPVLDHAVRHAMYVSGGREPMDAVDWMLGMNAEALASDRIRQDVLLMVGRADAFQSPRLADAQQAALSHARSVTRRDFTTAESAADHCQMGNLGLACEVLTAWLKLEL